MADTMLYIHGLMGNAPSGSWILKLSEICINRNFTEPMHSFLFSSVICKLSARL
jgi:hypothetical protein